MVSDQCKSRRQAEPQWEIHGQSTLGGFCRGELKWLLAREPTEFGEKQET